MAILNCTPDLGVSGLFWLVFALILFIFQIVTILLLEFRHPTKTVAWLLILFIFPIIGFVMYYFLAKEYTHRRTVRRKGQRMLGELRRDLNHKARLAQEINDLPNQEIHREDRLFALLHNIPSSPITKCNEVKVLSDPKEAFASILEALEGAQRHIHLEYYTIRADDIGRRFQQLLIAKARQGVEVRLIYDGVGSYELPQAYLKPLREAGVLTYCFLPPLVAFFDKRANYRNHRKIVVVDGQTGFLGGVNIGDEYLGKDPKLSPWRDTHLRIEGDAVYYLQHTFLTDWGFVSGEKLASPEYFPEHVCEGDEHVQIVSSGPDTAWAPILEVYLGAIGAAKEQIYIATPYFIPDSSVNMALKTAAVSGIDVRIVLPGVTDSQLVYLASMSYVTELLQAGVRFYRYKEGFMHAKIMLIDRMLASVGTANMDMRSFFSNFEINALLFDRKSVSKLEQDFLHDFERSEEIELELFEQRPRLQRFKEVLARLLSPLF
jgi:cardiolipin synthase A/B